jgi:hypothetical protein
VRTHYDAASSFDNALEFVHDKIFIFNDENSSV